MIEQKQNGAASIDIADILVAILTSAALPVVSHMLTLVFGDSSLWSVDRLMVLYFSSHSGWILRESFRLAMVQSGLKAGATLLWILTRPVMRYGLFPLWSHFSAGIRFRGLWLCWLFIAPRLLSYPKNKDIICIDAGKMCFNWGYGVLDRSAN